MEPNARPGLGIEIADFSDHVGQIFIADAAQTAQRAKVALGQKIEMPDQRLHCRIETVAFLELNGEAFGQIARAHAERLERLQNRKHQFDVTPLRAKFFGNRVEIAGEIAGLVDHIDQVLADHAAGRIGDRQRQLLGKMVSKGDLRRGISFQVVIVVLTTRTDARPFRISRRRHLGWRGFFTAIVGKYVFEFGPKPLLHGAAAGLKIVTDPIRGAGGILVTLDRRSFGLGACRGCLILAGTVEQRVALQLTFHVGRQIKAGELQQLDGLHQLRRHHQRLCLAELQSL